MVYYTRETLPERPVLGSRLASINEFFLASYNLSIYNGCEIGCAYCDGWAYHPRSFSNTVRVPLELPRRLAQELAGVHRGDLIAITALSDPYQSIERDYRITRQVLQQCADVGQPCLVLTKSMSILEDIDLLKRINAQSLAVVMTTLLTMDQRIATHLEGKAIPPALRLEMLSAMKQAGIAVGVALLPVIPYVNDTGYSLHEMMRACSATKVDFLMWDFLHMPNTQHRNRMQETLSRVGSYPGSYYRDIYEGGALPNNRYREETHRVLLRWCDDFGLPPRMPHRLFSGRLQPTNEAALLLKHLAFRDMVQGRQHMATHHRTLADAIYRGEATPTQLRNSPVFPTLAAILGIDNEIN